MQAYREEIQFHADILWQDRHSMGNSELDRFNAARKDASALDPVFQSRWKLPEHRWNVRSFSWGLNK
jgi:hypothetical protein